MSYAPSCETMAQMRSQGYSRFGKWRVISKAHFLWHRDRRILGHLPGTWWLNRHLHWTCLHSTTPPQPSKSGAQPHESLASQFKPGLSHLSLHSYKSPPTLSPPSSSLQYFSLFPGQISPSRQGPWQGNNYENRLFQDLSTGLLVMPCNQLGRKVTSSSRPSSDTYPMLAPPGWSTFSSAVLAVSILATSTN